MIRKCPWSLIVALPLLSIVLGCAATGIEKVSLLTRDKYPAVAVFEDANGLEGCRLVTTPDGPAILLWQENEGFLIKHHWEDSQGKYFAMWSQLGDEYLKAMLFTLDPSGQHLEVFGYPRREFMVVESNGIKKVIGRNPDLRMSLRRREGIKTSLN